MKDEPHGNDIEHLRAKPADIVERLRGHYDYTQPECYAWHKEAADEIELLRGALKYNEAEIERLRALITTYTAANGEELPSGSAGTTIVNDGRPT